MAQCSGALPRTPGNPPVIGKMTHTQPYGSVQALLQAYWQERKYRVRNGNNAPFHAIFVHQMQVHSSSVALLRSRPTLYNYHDSIDGVTGRAQSLVWQ